MGCRRRLCRCRLRPWHLTFWRENLISMSPGLGTYVTQFWSSKWVCMFLTAHFGQISSLIVTKILHSHGFLGHHLLWPWPLTYWPQNLNSTSMKPNTSVTDTGRNSIHSLVFWDMVFTSFLARTDSLTHRWTHPKKERLQQQGFSAGGCIKIPQFNWHKNCQIYLPFWTEKITSE